MISKILSLSLFAFVLLFSVSISSTSAGIPIEYVDKDTPLVNLTNANFDDLVLSKQNGPWFIMFFAPWCGHCKRAAPAWFELSKVLQGRVNVGIVDCDANAYIKRRFSIRGYPTFIYFEAGQLYQYKQGRNVEEWTQFALGEYRNTESEAIPNEPDSFRDFAKEISNVMDQVKFLFNQKPLVLAALIVGFIVLVSVSFWCTAKISDKVFGDQLQQQPAGTAVEGADAAGVKKSDATVKEGRPKTD